ncbi:unnamed protein product, partial [Staurois parvus]
YKYKVKLCIYSHTTTITNTTRLPYFRSIRRTFSPPKKGGKCQCVLWSEYKAAGPVFLPPPCQNTGPAAQLFSPARPYLFLVPALHSLPALASVTAGCPLRMSCALRRAIHKAQCFSRMRSGHPAVTEAGPGRRGKDNSAEVGAGTCQIQVPTPPPSPKVSSLWSSLHCVRSLWSSPALCPQSLVISCTVSAVSGHLLHCVRSLWSSPALCPQSLVISCTVSAVSGHLLHCVRSLWSSPALCPQSLVISCTVSAVSGHLLHCVRRLWSSPALCPQSLV